MAFQLLLSPYLEYYIFKLKIYGGMNIDDITYYSYTLPCTFLLHLGLELLYPKSSLENKLFEILPTRRKEIERRGFVLIAAGYGGHLLASIMPSIGAIDFVVHLLGFSRLIGFLYLWFSGSKYTILGFFIVIVPFTIEAINETMLVHLIVYITILMSIYFMKHRTSRLKIYSIFIFATLFLTLVQSVKYGYRTVVNEKDFQGSRTALFTKTIFDQINNYDQLDIKKLAGVVNVRLNQGWILSDILNNLDNKPNRIQPTYFKREVAGVILPRFLYPNKPAVGDHTKFHDFTGWRLSKKVAMSVGLMGDGYGNFGKIGGMLYCLGFGLIMGLFFKYWHQLGNKYPTLLLWGVMIFFYCMRAGDETYIIFNWIFKSSIFVFAYFFLFERNFTLQSFIRKKPQFYS